MYIKRLSEVRKPHGLQVAQDLDGREVYIVRDAAGGEHVVDNLESVRIVTDSAGGRTAIYEGV